MNSHIARVTYTVIRAGNDRFRCSRAPASSITSSTRAAGNALAKTPIDTRSGSRSAAERASRVTPAMIERYQLKEAPLGDGPPTAHADTVDGISICRFLTRG
jgi:hypothetical protein